MKILFVDQFGELGGAQRCLLDLLPAVSAAGWTATVCAPGDGPLLTRAGELGCGARAIALGGYSSGEKPWREKLRFAWQTAGLVRSIDGEAKRLRPDVLYVNGPRVAPAAAVVARRRGLPLVYHCHHRLTDGVSIGLVRRALRSCNSRMIACCRFAAAPLDEALPPERRRVIYNGVGEGPGLRPRRNGSVRAIGVLGRVAPEKGQAEFVEAAALAAGRLPDCRFLVCGAPLFDDPAAQRYFDALVASAGSSKVEFLGWSDRAQEVLAGWDVAVVPSVREPATTRVILEAFACGVPVLAFATGGIPEVVEDGRTGVLVDPPTAEGLASALVDLAGREDLRAAIAANGRLAWERRFTVERYRAEVLDQVAEAANGAA